MNGRGEPQDESVDSEVLCSCGCLVQIVRQPDGTYTVRVWPCAEEAHREAADELRSAA